MRKITGRIMSGLKAGDNQNIHYGIKAVAGLCFILLFLLISRGVLAVSDVLVVGNFSASTPDGTMPKGWKPLTFKKIKTLSRYRHVVVDGRWVIKARSENGASGLIRKITINPAQYPIISWQWKVKNILSKGDVSKKSGDDYPARIYITFAYDSKKTGFWEGVKFDAYKMVYGEYPPVGTISYIWANKAGIGRIFTNPYADRVKMIVIESGTDRVGKWVRERRNIADDYRAAFKKNPPLISGIAIMTDTDNTGQAATAWYGDIIMSRQ
ncbi:hypothetical protein MNBD_DELTA04-1776 [hydrothermal vent metagenome]|uniref:DUF3047 domain-containing protein n=1 Tax=hydrothermal vent metagenome TaxID=652676 RepID=A0A3B0V7C2_9ZZZZ